MKRRRQTPRASVETLVGCSAGAKRRFVVANDARLGLLAVGGR
jgi:hypothetical protein